MRMLVTGASGFVGRALTSHLIGTNHEVIALCRSGDIPGAKMVHADLITGQDLRKILRDIDVVFHIAGKAHAVGSRERGAEATFWPLNVAASAHLAVQSAEAGVRRFVFLSSVHVNGRLTGDRPFREDDAPSPAGAYGRSKLAGEEAVKAALAESATQWCIVRPPLVVGPGARANLASLINLVRSGIPLPVKNIGNRRSLIGAANLAHFLKACAINPSAGNQLFLIADEPPLSTEQLVRLIARSLRSRVRLFKIPGMFWRAADAVPYLRTRLGPLWESLEIDSGKARTVQGWTGIEPLESAIDRAVRSQ